MPYWEVHFLLNHVYGCVPAWRQNPHLACHVTMSQFVLSVDLAWTLRLSFHGQISIGVIWKQILYLRNSYILISESAFLILNSNSLSYNAYAVDYNTFIYHFLTHTWIWHNSGSSGEIQHVSSRDAISSHRELSISHKSWNWYILCKWWIKGYQHKVCNNSNKIK